MDTPIFLTKAQVFFAHQDLIETYGGSHGVRDEGLLESALEMPQAGFGEEYFHKTLFEIAYLYHLVKNHPFIDGNKRIGFACADLFLTIVPLVSRKTQFAMVISTRESRTANARIAVVSLLRSLKRSLSRRRNGRLSTVCCWKNCPLRAFPVR